jgi:hypothetical protein
MITHTDASLAVVGPRRVCSSLDDVESCINDIRFILSSGSSSVSQQAFSFLDMVLAVFVNLDRAAHRFHHRPNVRWHIGHTVAALVEPVTKETHPCAGTLEQFW